MQRGTLNPQPAHPSPPQPPKGRGGSYKTPRTPPSPQVIYPTHCRMISCLLLVLGAGSALAGVNIQMPYLNPAGVTYTTLPRAVPAVPTHLQYAPATTSSVAYGNGAFLGRALTHAAVPYAAAPVAHYAAAPVAHYAAAPVAHYAAAPVAHYRASVVPTVHHVPAYAQVPVTKYEAQPAVVQNLVDVARPKLATRKIEIRRPAIQKEFYDVEERVVIRPAGSAVVELDQPVSKNQRGPTVVQPAVHAVAAVHHGYAAVRAAPVVGFRSLHHNVYQAAYPSVSVHPYPIQGPALASPVSTPASSQEIQQQEQQQYPEEIPQQPQQFPEQNPQQEFEQQNSQQFAPQFPQQIPQQPQQFDDSDSVAIDNPDIARARAQQAQQQQPQQPEQSQQAQGRAQISPRIEQEQQQIISEFQTRMQERADRQQDIARSQVAAQEQVVAQLQAQAQSQQAQLQRSQQILQVQQQFLERSRQAVDSTARSQQNPAQPAPLDRSQPDQEEGLASVGPTPERPEFRSSVEAADLRSALINNVARSSQSPSVIPSFRISPEQSLSNQERLISLLTARGGVVEARSSGSSGESHQVRARVLSVTPAPENAAPREEKVNTRRIVFSRPIQTVEEVDVVEPFTKIERVAVHSPAVIKTARLGVAHVPASLPVHGYAHAVTAAPIAVY